MYDFKRANGEKLAWNSFRSAKVVPGENLWNIVKRGHWRSVLGSSRSLVPVAWFNIAFFCFQTATKDERLQPWYIAAILRPKNVVILFDISYSMKEENKIIFARTAITPVLKGLLPTDFVNVGPQPSLLATLEHSQNVSFSNRNKELIIQEW